MVGMITTTVLAVVHRLAPHLVENVKMYVKRAINIAVDVEISFLYIVYQKYNSLLDNIFHSLFLRGCWRRVATSGAAAHLVVAIRTIQSVFRKTHWIFGIHKRAANTEVLLLAELFEECLGMWML